MILIAIGESLKNLDRLTGGTLLAEYPSVTGKRKITAPFLELDGNDAEGLVGTDGE